MYYLKYSNRIFYVLWVGWVTLAVPYTYICLYWVKMERWKGNKHGMIGWALINVISTIKSNLKFWPSRAESFHKELAEDKTFRNSWKIDQDSFLFRSTRHCGGAMVRHSDSVHIRPRTFIYSILYKVRHCTASNYFFAVVIVYCTKFFHSLQPKAILLIYIYCTASNLFFEVV